MIELRGAAWCGGDRNMKYFLAILVLGLAGCSAPNAMLTMQHEALVSCYNSTQGTSAVPVKVYEASMPPKIYGKTLIVQHGPIAIEVAPHRRPTTLRHETAHVVASRLYPPEFGDHGSKWRAVYEALRECGG